MEFNHYSVLLAETIEQLHIKPDGIYVDGTLGGGGHAYKVCEQLTSGHFYGIDQDDAAILAAGERLAPFGDKVTILRSNYCNVKALLAAEGVEKVDGIVLDLGVSSYQSISLTRRREDFPIASMLRLICGWTEGRRSRRHRSSTNTPRWNYIAS